MNVEELRKICTSFPAVTEDIKWENHLCFNVGGKMFFITGLEQIPITASFKTNDDDFEILSAREGFQPAPYLARHKWIHTSDINNLSSEEWKKLISNSYEIIKSKLPKKILSGIENKF